MSEQKKKPFLKSFSIEFSLMLFPKFQVKFKMKFSR